MADDYDEHTGINESGGSIGLDDFLDTHVESDASELAGNFGADDIRPGSNSKNRSRNNGGRWVLEGATIDETFRGGPVCLSILSRLGVSQYQHNFLFMCAIFLKRKYPENWTECLRWVNLFVLRPSGDGSRLEELIKDFKKRDRPYEYRCKDAPVNAHCHSHACRMEPFGVGSDKEWVGELSMTILDRTPRLFYVGDVRMACTADDLLTIKRYQAKCMEHGLDFPINIRHQDWQIKVKEMIESATLVEPSVIMQTNAEEKETLVKYFGMHIPNWYRAEGEAYATGKCGEQVRIKDGRIYFKWEKLKNYLERQGGLRSREMGNMREYLSKHAEFHSRTDLRDWFRSTWSVQFEFVDPGVWAGWTAQT